jgi:hypothetical protein
MKLCNLLIAASLLAAPVAAGAQGVGAGHMGGGHGVVAASVRAGAARGVGLRGGGFRHRGRFRGGALLWGWYDYPLWAVSSDCAYPGVVAGCEEDAAYDVSAARDRGRYSADPLAACGGWVQRAGRFVWLANACGADAKAPSPARRAAASANECSDWVWRADLRHSVCKRPAAG